MNLVLWCVAALVGSVSADTWSWPEGEASVRIDTKVGFLDHPQTIQQSNKSPSDIRQDDEVPFREPQDTSGFYNQPPGAGRYPVRVEGPGQQTRRGENYYHNGPKDIFHDDSNQVCKCLGTPECIPRPNSETACGLGKYLCCYKKQRPQYSEYFNEVTDERPILSQGNENPARPFLPPHGLKVNGLFGPIVPGHDDSIVGVYEKNKPNMFLVPGENGSQHKPGVLVGPDGPTGQIGPAPYKNDARLSETAQRGVLVGPGGPTGIIGPGGYSGRPVLSGPGGPTGIIGPTRGPRGHGILVGPGGPTGIIGPNYGRQRPQVLVGPGGPTGIIGPRRPYYGDYFGI